MSHFSAQITALSTFFVFNLVLFIVCNCTSQKLEPWLQEVRVLQQLGMKTELEALFSNPRFTSAVYLPSKLLGVCSPNSNANRSSIGSVVDRSHSQPLFPIANNFL